MRSCLFLVAFLFFAALCHPATYTVPGNFPTIQDAILAAVTGDTIVVRPGTYGENVYFNGQDIALIAEQGPAVTVIDGMQNGPVVIFNRGEGPAARLEGFTITNGTGVRHWSHYGYYCYGGGIYCDGASPAIVGNTVTGNSLSGTSASGGGIYLAYSTAHLSGNTVAANSATGTTYQGGGGIACVEASVVVEDCVVTGNTPGGIACDSDNGAMAPVLRRNRIESNSGTGIALTTNFGGPMTALVAANRISGNTGSGLRDTSTASLITGNEIVDNGSAAGGGILSQTATSTIANNRISGNTSAQLGGGILCSGSTQLLINNTFCGNTATLGGGLYCGGSAAVTVVNTICWDNTAPTGPQIGVGRQGSPATLTIGYSDTQGGQASVAVGPGSVLGWKAGMIDSDPLFVAPVDGDFHIRFTSPCRDGGFNHASLPATDMEGDPRAAGTAADMGADEFYFHLYSTGAVRPGSPLRISVVGIPGRPVQLAMGSAVLDPPIPTSHGPLYLPLPFVRTWSPGPIGAEGILDIPATVPSSWLPGERYPFQALVGTWGSAGTRLTKAMVLTVE